MSAIVGIIDFQRLQRTPKCVFVICAQVEGVVRLKTCVFVLCLLVLLQRQSKFRFESSSGSSHVMQNRENVYQLLLILCSKQMKRQKWWLFVFRRESVGRGGKKKSALLQSLGRKLDRASNGRQRYIPICKTLFAAASYHTCHLGLWTKYIQSPYPSVSIIV